jgi:pseudouridylate synthase
MTRRNPSAAAAPRLGGDVAAALAEGRAVVALESSIIAHGLPQPRNVTTAFELEDEVRRAGAVPATIAVLEGVLTVGLSAAEIELLGSAEDVLKLSRADLPYAIAAGRTGATTVAATMIAAHLAGIRVFATGGIGGVHRGVEATMDVSADLDELARTPVAVVCAGAKAILDLPRTLEYLETRGVPVIGYRTDELPAFWSRSSGLDVPLRLDAAGDIARVLRVQRELGYPGGTLVVNPIPAADEIPASEIARHIDAALEAARRQSISGKALTPFLLDRIVDSTGGRSLAANVALAKNNAWLAAEIAVALTSVDMANP